MSAAGAMGTANPVGAALLRVSVVGIDADDSAHPQPGQRGGAVCHLDSLPRVCPGFSEQDGPVQSAMCRSGRLAARLWP